MTEVYEYTERIYKRNKTSGLIFLFTEILLGRSNKFSKSIAIFKII